MNAKRKRAEMLIYEVYDSLDSTGSNTNYWKTKFATMSDEEFVKWLETTKFPFKFQIRPFEIEPNLDLCKKALSILGVPLTERVAEPFLYQNKNGDPVWTHETFVGYCHLKKLKQFITKKNHMSTSITQRDMKSGQLLGEDKGARESDREFEALQVMGLDYTTIEFSKIKADAMDTKNQAYNMVNLTGEVRFSDLDIDPRDSLSKNMVSAYMVSSHLNTNIVNSDYMLPATLANKKSRIERR